MLIEVEQKRGRPIRVNTAMITKIEPCEFTAQDGEIKDIGADDGTSESRVYFSGSKETALILSSEVEKLKGGMDPAIKKILDAMLTAGMGVILQDIDLPEL